MNQPSIDTATQDMMMFHYGQLDKSGVPYHHHPYRVMLRLGGLSSEAERISALFHDVVEDTKWDFIDLRNFGYGSEILTAVALLTRSKSMTHRQYLQLIIDSGNVTAMRVKLADLYDNSWPMRVLGAPAEIRANLTKMIEERYKPSIMLVKEALGDRADGIIEGDVGDD